MTTPPSTTAIEHLDPSELGTKDHWEQAYHREAQNFLENPTDEGIIWFEESDAETRILSYLSKLPLTSRATASFLDVGTGNGHLLFTLLEPTSDDDDDDDDDEEEGDTGPYTGPMVGIDYSPASIALSRSIAAERGFGAQTRFEVADVIGDDLSAVSWVPEGGFEVVLDKGTFDAISLSEETLPDGRRVVERYPAQVAGVVRSGGWVVVTSCNWTEEELRVRMEDGGRSGLRWWGRVAYPSFRFGGREGSTVCTVCFRKV